MKLSDYAHKLGISYKTAWNWFRAGKIKGYQMDTGTIIIIDDDGEKLQKIAVYARVSSNKERSQLNSQAERLVAYCTAKEWHVHKVVKEIGSSIGENRKKLMTLLTDPTITIIVIEQKDRLVRFGFNYIESLLNQQDRQIIVVNNHKSKEELINDLGSVVYTVTSQIYGKRQGKRKATMTKQILKSEDISDESK
ncbi:MAG: hypothetical protein B6242_11285 [Anaerolineaceae bacterium 4572_78]|nr:MAG: hypothetical protein B6242_11285 [Anaerolineaceae bacterium 4572_78]